MKWHRDLGRRGRQIARWSAADVKKSEIKRPYAPDYVDAQTLAYRLSCAESTVWEKVRTKRIPPPSPTPVGPRWKWTTIEALIDGDEAPIADPFIVRVNEAKKRESGASET